MRRSVPWVLVAILGATLVLGASAATPAEEIGRYQIVPMWETVQGRGGGQWTYGPILLDTAEGATWRIRLSGKDDLNWYPMKLFNKTPK